MISADPFRERLHEQRIAALAQRGRTEEALTAYRVARTALNDELGLAPGVELQALHKRILDADPTLLGSGAVPAPPSPIDDPVPVEHDLPRRLTPIIGRGDELQQLGALLGESHLVSTVGAAGCGKTRLAVEFAHVFAPRFPRMASGSSTSPEVQDPALAVDLTLDTIGVAMPVVGSPLRALGAQVRGRQALIVLDNCEHLLPGLKPLVETLIGEDADCTVLATSREPLGVAGELTYTLSPLAVPRVGTSTAGSPAVTMFRARLRFADPTAALSEADLISVGAICRRLDGLPLAIELAAARGRTYSVAEIAEQVLTDPVGLRRPGPGPSAADGSLRGEIDRSYQLMTAAEQTLHRALAVFPGPFTASAAATTIADDLVDGHTVDLIAMLVNQVPLLMATRPVHAGGVSTFRQLRTVRAHAAQVGGDDLEREQLLDRRDAWVRSVLGRDFRLRRGEIMRYRTLDDSYALIRATLNEAWSPGATPRRRDWRRS